MCSKEAWMLRLLDALFWLFLIATILTVIFWIFIPTSTEWPGTFPYNIKWEEFWAPFLRHLSLFPAHFPITRFIDVINGVFLTMFVYKIGLDLKQGIENGDGNKKVGTSTYVEWAMGALLSGIIFASSSVATAARDRAIPTASVLLAAIFIFSFVSYYFLHKLRQKLRIEEQTSKVIEQ